MAAHTVKEIETHLEQTDHDTLRCPAALDEVLKAIGVRSFVSAAAEALVQTRDAPGAPCLLSLLRDRNLLPELLTDPALCGENDALAIAQAALALEPMLDAKLAAWLAIAKQEPDSDDRFERAFRLFVAIGGPRVLPAVMQFMRSPDQRVRSKAAQFVARHNRNSNWFEQIKNQADPRVVANAIESLWESEWEEAALIFRDAIASPHRRVVGNALVGLYLLGEGEETVRLAIDMCRSGDALSRATGAWVMGRTGDQRFVATLATMIRDPDPMVRRNVVKALGAIRKKNSSRTTSDSEAVSPELPEPSLPASPG